MSTPTPLVLWTGLVAGAPTTSLAHQVWGPATQGAGPSLADGLLHPLIEPDHLLLSAVVGVCAGRVGGRACLLWPVAFLAAAALGGSCVALGLPLPAIEPMLVLTLLALLAAALAARGVSLADGALMTGLAGLFHGAAHGVEGPGGPATFAFLAGCLVATTGIASLGVGVGRLWPRRRGPAAAPTRS